MSVKIKQTARSSGISTDLWWEVVMRDAREIWRRSEDCIHHSVRFDRWFKAQERICLAPTLDPSLSGTCSGRTTVDHVRSQPGGRRRHEAAFLVSGCMEHNVWHPPGRTLRERHRSYLRDRYPKQWEQADGEDSGRA